MGVELGNANLLTTQLDPTEASFLLEASRISRHQSSQHAGNMGNRKYKEAFKSL